MCGFYFYDLNRENDLFLEDIMMVSVMEINKINVVTGPNSGITVVPLIVISFESLYKGR